MADEETAVGDTLLEESTVSTPLGSGNSPSYGTMPIDLGFVRNLIAQAREDQDPVGCCSKSCSAFLNTVGATIAIALAAAIPVAMIVVGVLYLDECPRQRLIPIFLVVWGTVGTFKVLSTVIQRIVEHCRKRPTPPCDGNPFDAVVGLFLTIWFICGTVWTYQILNDYETTSGGPKYCAQVLYDFSFWIITLIYGIIWVLAILLCILRIGLNVACEVFWNKLGL